MTFDPDATLARIRDELERRIKEQASRGPIDFNEACRIVGEILNEAIDAGELDDDDDQVCDALVEVLERHDARSNKVLKFVPSHIRRTRDRV